MFNLMKIKSTGKALMITREKLEWEGLSCEDWMRVKYEKICKMTQERIMKDYWRYTK